LADERDPPGDQRAGGLVTEVLAGRLDSDLTRDDPLDAVTGATYDVDGG
jgi:hypothetical protein